MSIFKKTNQNELDALRHSAAHLLAAAVLELWPGTKNTIGPAIANGFYYDFEFKQPISENDLPAIENKMRELIVTWDEFKREEIDLKKAQQTYQDNQYKLELIEQFATEGKTLSLYHSGQFTDLCRGGHVAKPNKELKYFKLLSLAGAYWRGSEKNNMLTRIYGTAFFSQKELNDYLAKLEEAKKRDHRKIGQEQELFFFDSLVGKGLPMWLPKGTIIKNEIEKLAIKLENEFSYQRISTPHLAKEELYLTSGHLPYYQDSMYPAMSMDDGTYYLKAMNCPHHHLVFKSKPRSYRDLPVRLAEYGTVYRNELSGTLAGLLRVRSLQMNDAHIYCRRDQIKDEVNKVITLNLQLFKIFQLNNFWFRLSKWDPNHKEKYIDEPSNWEYSQNILREVLQDNKVDFVEADDEAAFYGPKIDVQFESVIGREETMSTIQLDFVAKSKFNLNYTNDKGQDNQEIFVIHRAPLSTHERFMAFLIEHYAGVWPIWLSPVQVAIISVGKEHHDFCHQLAAEFKKFDIRVEVDDANETVGNKIRKASHNKIPYILVIGDKEIKSDQLIVRVRGQEKLLTIGKKEFIDRLLLEINERQ